MDDEIEVRDHPEVGRYEATAGGRLAGVVGYRFRPDAVVFTHTEVLPEWEGRGIGGRLARAALDDARERGMTVVPRCRFIRGWIRRHPEYADLLAADERELLERRR
jgi:predicted GNAT family acetyltransferase